MEMRRTPNKESIRVYVEGDALWIKQHDDFILLETYETPKLVKMLKTVYAELFEDDDENITCDGNCAMCDGCACGGD